jgi:hypothetical protein
MDRRDRAVFDHPRQGAPVLGLEQGGLAGCFVIDQAGRPFGVKPDDPIPHDLKADATDLGGLPTRAPGRDRCQRQEPSGLVGILAVTRQAAQMGGVEIGTERNGQ